MDTATSVIFGLLFLTLGFAAVFLMFRIWGIHLTRRPIKAQRLSLSLSFTALSG
jgi:hypothetical protein